MGSSALKNLAVPKSSQDAAESIALVRNFFADRDEFKLVLVFGSAVGPTFKASSDVDIAVAGTMPFDYDLLSTIQAQLSVCLGRPVDLLDLAKAEGLILLRAVTQGLRIKTDPALFVRFHTKALSYREDFMPTQMWLRDARIARFIHGS